MVKLTNIFLTLLWSLLFVFPRRPKTTSALTEWETMTDWRKGPGGPRRTLSTSWIPWAVLWINMTLER